MNKIYFVADVHLERTNKAKKSLFLSFLKKVKSEKGDLFILGDLFDYWANNRILLKEYFDVFNTLREISLSGSRVGLIIGNRDFLLTSKFLSRFRIEFLGEEKTILVDNKKILLTHGYLLCSKDKLFHHYKSTRWPVFRVLDKILPGFVENFLAQRFILKSKEVILAQNGSIFEITDDTLRKYFNSGIDVIICGHIHRELVKDFSGKTLYVLPCWDSKKGGYLLYEDGQFRLMTYCP